MLGTAPAAPCSCDRSASIAWMTDRSCVIRFRDAVAVTVPSVAIASVPTLPVRPPAAAASVGSAAPNDAGGTHIRADGRIRHPAAAS